MHSVTRNTVVLHVIKLSLGTCAHVSYTVYEGTRTQVFVKIHQQDKSVCTVLLATVLQYPVAGSTQLITCVHTRDKRGTLGTLVSISTRSKLTCIEDRSGTQLYRCTEVYLDICFHYLFLHVQRITFVTCFHNLAEWYTDFTIEL